MPFFFGCLLIDALRLRHHALCPGCMIGTTNCAFKYFRTAGAFHAFLALTFTLSGIHSHISCGKLAKMVALMVRHRMCSEEVEERDAHELHSSFTL